MKWKNEGKKEENKADSENEKNSKIKERIGGKAKRMIKLRKKRINKNSYERKKRVRKTRIMKRLRKWEKQ